MQSNVSPTTTSHLKAKPALEILIFLHSSILAIFSMRVPGVTSTSTRSCIASTCSNTAPEVYTSNLLLVLRIGREHGSSPGHLTLLSIFKSFSLSLFSRSTKNTSNDLYTSQTVILSVNKSRQKMSSNIPVIVGWNRISDPSRIGIGINDANGRNIMKSTLV